MARKKLKKVNSKDALTLVGQGVSFNGVLAGQGTVRVEGGFEGEIRVEGDVIIGESSEVSAVIEASNLTVSGSFKGTARISGRLQISPRGRVEGEVQADRLAVEDGGILLGQCNARPASPGQTPGGAGNP